MINLAPIGIELFPPNTPAGFTTLQQTLQQFSPLKIRHYSVTYGAGGSVQANTQQLVNYLQHHAQHATVVPHLTCVGADKKGLLTLLHTYDDMGIDTILTLRGDVPAARYFAQVFPESTITTAKDLVVFVRQHFGERFNLIVAAYPEIHPKAISAKADIAYLKAKADAGAGSAITQYCYNADAYFRLVDDLQRLQCDEIPRWILLRLQDYQDDPASLKAFGIEVVSQLCEQLLAASVPGLHFYTMNRVEPTLTIARHLGY